MHEYNSSILSDAGWINELRDIKEEFPPSSRLTRDLFKFLSILLGDPRADFLPAPEAWVRLAWLGQYKPPPNLNAVISNLKAVILDGYQAWALDTLLFSFSNFMSPAQYRIMKNSYRFHLLRFATVGLAALRNVNFDLLWVNAYVRQFNDIPHLTLPAFLQFGVGAIRNAQIYRPIADAASANVEEALCVI
jgi:hypothetical protein